MAPLQTSKNPACDAPDVSKTVKTVGGVVSVIVIVVGIAVGLVTDRSTAFNRIGTNEEGVKRLEMKIQTIEIEMQAIKTTTIQTQVDVSWIRNSMEDKHTP